MVRSASRSSPRFASRPSSARGRNTIRRSGRPSAARRISPGAASDRERPRPRSGRPATTTTGRRGSRDRRQARAGKRGDRGRVEARGHARQVDAGRDFQRLRAADGGGRDVEPARGERLGRAGQRLGVLRPERAAAQRRRRRDQARRAPFIDLGAREAQDLAARRRVGERLLAQDHGGHAHGLQALPQISRRRQGRRPDRPATASASTAASTARSPARRGAAAAAASAARAPAAPAGAEARHERAAAR